MTFRINNTLFFGYENFDRAFTGEILEPLYAGYSPENMLKMMTIIPIFEISNMLKTG